MRGPGHVSPVLGTSESDRRLAWENVWPGATSGKRPQAASVGLMAKADGVGPHCSGDEGPGNSQRML